MDDIERDFRFLRLTALARRIDDFVWDCYADSGHNIDTTARKLGLEIETVETVITHRRNLRRASFKEPA